MLNYKSFYLEFILLFKHLVCKIKTVYDEIFKYQLKFFNNKINAFRR